MKSKFLNPALFKLERRKGLSTLIWFSAITAVLIFLSCAIYPAIKDVLAGNTALAQLGITFDSMADYFNAEALEMWLLPVLLFVSCSVVMTTTNEFRNGSYELIYTLNISRCEIIRTKLVKVVLDTLIINIVSFGVSAIGLAIFSNGGINYLNLLVYFLMAFLVSVEVAFIIFAITLVGKKRVNMFTGIVISVVFYLFATLMNVGENGSTEALGFLTPLSALNGTIMTNGFAGIFKHGIVLAVWGAISIILLLLGVQRFKNDDLV